MVLGEPLMALTGETLVGDENPSAGDIKIVLGDNLAIFY